MHAGVASQDLGKLCYPRQGPVHPPPGSGLVPGPFPSSTAPYPNAALRGPAGPHKNPRMELVKDTESHDRCERAFETLGIRQPARKKREMQREHDWHSSNKREPLPMYKCYFDDNLQNMWAGPQKRAHLQGLGFLDKSGSIVDIHQARSKYALCEHEIKELHNDERIEKRERESLRKAATVRALRENVTDMRLKQVSDVIALKRAQRTNASQSTGNLSASGQRAQPWHGARRSGGWAARR